MANHKSGELRCPATALIDIGSRGPLYYQCSENKDVYRLQNFVHDLICVFVLAQEKARFS